MCWQADNVKGLHYLNLIEEKKLDVPPNELLNVHVPPSVMQFPSTDDMLLGPEAGCARIPIILVRHMRFAKSVTILRNPRPGHAGKSLLGKGASSFPSHL